MPNNPQTNAPTFNEKQYLIDKGFILEGDEGIPLGSGVLAGRIGRGGMAVVYKIWNRDLDTFRAIKIANPGADEHFYRRFVSEARIMEKLKHHNIIEIKAIGKWYDLPFIEMEYIDGSTLRDIIDKRDAFSVNVACSIAINVLNALEYAHSETVSIEGQLFKGIFHRDLKPENIVISRTGRIVVMDFGLARPIAQGINSTIVSMFVGTPRYAAPEQFQMGKTDHRVDLYAMGLILYEMLTGRHPFAVINERCRDAEEYITERKKITWQMIDTTSMKLPSRLVKIIRRCLETDPDKRYRSAGEMLDELEAYCHGRAGIADSEFIALNLFETGKTAVAPTQAPAGIRGRKGILALLATVGGVVVLAGAVSIFLLTGPREPAVESDEAVSPVTTADGRRVAAVSPQSPVNEQESALEQKRPLTTEGERTMRSKPPASNERTTSQPPRPPSSQVKKSPDSPNVPDAAFADAHRTAAIPSKLPAAKESTAVASPGNPIDLLKKRYGSDNFFTIASSALQQKKFDDALQALAAIPDNDPDAKKKSVLLLDCYVQAERFMDAKRIVDGPSIDAMEFYYLSGRTYFFFGNYGKAINLFNRALEKRCLMPERRESLIDDALYYSALTSRKRYYSEDDRTTENLDAARNAWQAVKERFADNPSNSRFKEAVEVLSKL